MRKVAGSNPARSTIVLTQSSLLEFAFHLKREGHRPLTIESNFGGLKALTKICDLGNPDSGLFYAIYPVSFWLSMNG